MIPRRVRVFLPLIICCFSLVRAQEVMPSIIPEEVSGLSVGSTRTFDGNSLYGYIDGGADLVLEYGFDRLLVQELRVPEGELKIEVYRMTTPRAALGLYSLALHRCSPDSSLAFYSCVSSFSVRFVRGRFSVCIINPGGTLAGERRAREIARIVAAKITEPAEDMAPAVFAEGPFRGERALVRVMAGPLAVQNGIPEWSEFLEDIGPFDLVMLPLEKPSGWVRLAYLHCLQASGVEVFLKNVGLPAAAAGRLQRRRDGSVSRYARQVGAQHVLFLETTLPEEEQAEYVAVLQHS